MKKCQSRALIEANKRLELALLEIQKIEQLEAQIKLRDQKIAGLEAQNNRAAVAIFNRFCADHGAR